MGNIKLGNLSISDIKYGDKIVSRIYAGDIIVYDNFSNIILFDDLNVKTICVEKWGSNGEITYDQAGLVTDLGTSFARNPSINTFNELQYFEGLTILGTLDGGESDIDFGVFTENTSLESIILPDTLKKIGTATFYGCILLKNIVIPSSIEEMGVGVFAGCVSLSSIEIPNSITYINSSTFINCQSLISINLPESINEIRDMAFQDCIRLESISIESLNPPILGILVFNRCSNLTNIYVPSESVEIYKNATGWRDYANMISAIVK